MSDIISPECWYDYLNQAWVINGRYADCNHPDDMKCTCYGRRNAGRPASDTQRIRDEMKWLQQFGMNEDQYRESWRALESWLQEHPLPTADGGIRMATVGEFMMMNATAATVDFKHRQTRKYLYLALDTIAVAVWNRETGRGELTEFNPGECFAAYRATFDDPYTDGGTQ